jgi:hypothetical protein
MARLHQRRECVDVPPLGRDPYRPSVSVDDDE